MGLLRPRTSFGGFFDSLILSQRTSSRVWGRMFGLPLSAEFSVCSDLEINTYMGRGSAVGYCQRDFNNANTVRILVDVLWRHRSSLWTGVIIFLSDIGKNGKQDSGPLTLDEDAEIHLNFGENPLVFVVSFSPARILLDKWLWRMSNFLRKHITPNPPVTALHMPGALLLHSLGSSYHVPWEVQVCRARGIGGATWHDL